MLNVIWKFTLYTRNAYACMHGVLCGVWLSISLYMCRVYLWERCNAVDDKLKGKQQCRFNRTAHTYTTQADGLYATAKQSIASYAREYQSQGDVNMDLLGPEQVHTQKGSGLIGCFPLAPSHGCPRVAATTDRTDENRNVREQRKQKQQTKMNEMENNVMHNFFSLSHFEQETNSRVQRVAMAVLWNDRKFLSTASSSIDIDLFDLWT